MSTAAHSLQNSMSLPQRTTSHSKIEPNPSPTLMDIAQPTNFHCKIELNPSPTLMGIAQPTTFRSINKPTLSPRMHTAIVVSCFLPLATKHRGAAPDRGCLDNAPGIALPIARACVPPRLTNADRKSKKKKKERKGKERKHEEMEVNNRRIRSIEKNGPILDIATHTSKPQENRRRKSVGGNVEQAPYAGISKEGTREGNSWTAQQTHVQDKQYMYWGRRLC